MRIPVQHSRTEPSMQLSMHLSKLKSIAAISKVLHQDQLFVQARDAYNKLVNQYNSQLPVEKKGFWKEFVDNLTFNMNTNTVIRLESLDNDSDFNSQINSYKSMDRELLIELLNDFLKSPY